MKIFLIFVLSVALVFELSRDPQFSDTFTRHVVRYIQKLPMTPVSICNFD